jgi:hypothetical protein
MASAVCIYQYRLEDSLIHEAITEINSIPKEERFRWAAAKLYRETLEFGLIYRHLEEGKIVENPMPACVAKIRQILHAKFHDQIHDGASSEEFNNCIVSFYKAGDGMVPHIDRAARGAKDGRERNYFFGNSILGVILAADTKQSLYFLNPDSNEKIVMEEKKGTAFLFQGPLRQTWKHGLDPIETTRVSMTFRKVIFRDCC